MDTLEYRDKLEFGTGLETEVTPTRRAATMICFSHLRWDFVYQRPQHLLSRASRAYRLTYVEEPIFDDVATPHYRYHRHGEVRVATPVLPHGRNEADSIADQRILLDSLVDDNGGSVDIAWYYTPMALEFSDHLQASLTVYDCMDELSAFRGASPRLVSNEKRLLERADLVFTGGRSIYEAKRRFHPAVYPFPSSVDSHHFRQARNRALADPVVQAGLPHPRLGFFGVIDERLDLELVEATARLRPDISFVLLGPVVKIDPASLPQRPNLFWLGSQDYQQLPAFISGWDAGYMPFAMNEATRFISPTKTPEFLAAGLPVVSTPIADVVRPYGEEQLVQIAATPQQMATALDRALAMDRGPWLQRVDAFLSGMSWDKTWSEMRSLMQGEAAASRSVVRAGTIAAVAGRQLNV